MITLAQRVRDFRYSKGWGPDELANRAEISRTALYQIESGKTGLPRAGTLRRIALALDVSMDDLLGHAEPANGHASRLPVERASGVGRERDMADWMPSEGGPLAMPAGAASATRPHYANLELGNGEDARFGIEPQRRLATGVQEGLQMRGGELMSKLHDLLHSPLGLGIARVIDELHTMIPRNRTIA